MTARQKQLHDFIRRHWSLHGQGPTYLEMAAAMGGVGNGVIAGHVRRLAERGHLRVVPGRSRGVIPLLPGRRVRRTEWAA